MVSSVCSKLLIVVAALCAMPVAAMSPELSAAATTADTVFAEHAVVRPVTSAYGIEAGSAHLADTYLTPLHYDGWHSAVSYSRTQAMGFDPERWSMRLALGVAVDHTQNPARNATMWNLDFEASWAMTRRFRVTDAVSAGIGGYTALNVGALYLGRNGNNPASAKGAWAVGVRAAATYAMRIGRLPITWGVEAAIPLTGVFFTPQYGQLYYEIYLGDRRGLAHAAWPGNYRRIDTRAWADMHFGGTTLRLGYHFDLRSTRANDITSRSVTHAFSVAVVTRWLSVPMTATAVPADARIIAASY